MRKKFDWREALFLSCVVFTIELLLLAFKDATIERGRVFASFFGSLFGGVLFGFMKGGAFATRKTTPTSDDAS